MNWEPDRNLRARMLVAIALVVLLPFGFAVAMHWLFTEIVPYVAAAYFGIGSAATATIGPPGGFGGTFYLVCALIAAGLVGQFLFGDRIAMRSNGARPADPDAYPRLHAQVRRLAQQADLPVPSVAVIDSEVPNAYALGRTRAASTVVVTEALLDELDDDELEAVLAHEIAHIKNRDSAIMTVAYLLPSLTYLVAVGTYWLLGKVLGGAVRTLARSRKKNAGGVVAVVALFAVTSVLTILVSTAFWIGSYLIHRILSRYREYAADRGAAALTGDPYSLASALETIDDSLHSAPDEDLRLEDGGIEALYVAPLDTEVFDREDERALISRDLFPETHPPTEERVERLTDLAD